MMVQLLTAGLVIATATALVAAAAAVRSGRAARAASHALAAAEDEAAERLASMAASALLASNLAHDLNDLLTGIVGHAELLIVERDPAAAWLAEAKEIVRLASGGARLTRPLQAIDAGSPSRRADAGGRPPPATVLVVEDEPGVRELIRSVLARAGHAVITADGPRAARAALERQPAVALMVVDLVIPELDGYALVAEVRQVSPGIPVIFISGFAPDLARQAPGDAFLAKPFSSEALTGLVRETLAAVVPALVG